MTAREILESLGAPVRACADCEKELGILDRRDATKSHGQCRKHWIAFAIEAGVSQEEAENMASEMEQKNPAAFPPQLTP